MARNEEWMAAIAAYRVQCQDILDASPDIRYAGVINTYGRTMTGIKRPSIKPLLKPEELKQEFFLISTLMSLRRDMSGSLGDLGHIAIHHKKATILLFQKDNVTFYVSVNKRVKDASRIVSLIKKRV